MMLGKKKLADTPPSETGQSVYAGRRRVELIDAAPSTLVSPRADDRNLVLCDANGIERTRLTGFKDFRVTHDGVTYEHCATDDAGRWHYRPML